MLLLIDAILLDLSEEEMVHMFMRNTLTLFHGRTCIVCTMTMGNFPLSTLPKSNYYGWLYVLFACFFQHRGTFHLPGGHIHSRNWKNLASF